MSCKYAALNSSEPNINQADSTGASQSDHLIPPGDVLSDSASPQTDFLSSHCFTENADESGVAFRAPGCCQCPARRPCHGPDLQSISPNIKNSAGKPSVWRKIFTPQETQSGEIQGRLSFGGFSAKLRRIYQRVSRMLP